MKTKNNSKISFTFKSVSIALAFCMLVGCGGNTAIDSTKKPQSNTDTSPSEIRETQTVTEVIPGEDAKYRTEYVYDYYDDQYTTKPGQWSSPATQRTVQNLSNYNFDESKYQGISYSGGTNIRSESFTRGMGGTSYHATEKHSLSEATKLLDDSNLRELNVTSKRFWGEGTTSVLSSQYNYASNMNTSDVIIKQQFSDGSINGQAPLFATSNAVDLIATSWINKLSNNSIRKQLKATLIGNEYRIYFENKTTRAYEFSGYDETTLKLFREQWCVSRFKTISKLNKLCGTNFKSFSEVYPNSGNPILFYEFWLFHRDTFRNVMTNVMKRVDNVYSDIKWGYAAIGSNTDPLGNHLYLEMDYSSQNHYLNWFDNLRQYSFQTDNLTAWSKTAPVLITEVGYRNGTTDESMAYAARQYKQNLNLLYMRPRVVGSYIFNYTCANADLVTNSNTWGMVKPDRTKYPSFDAVAQIYADFKYLDKYYNGASNTPLVAISNQATTERLTGQNFISSSLASILYAQGVPIQVVPSDDSSRFDTLKETKLIFNDAYIYQNPDGSNDVGKSLENYMNKGNQVLRTVDTIPQKIYGIGNSFTGSNTKQLESKYKNLDINSISSKNQTALWNTLGKFIHGDFISGKITSTKNRIDENAVRILEVQGFDIKGLVDPTWEIEAQMVYKNGEMYLCVVNTSDKMIDKIDITLGVSKGVKCNLTPRIMRADGSVTVSRPERANIPSYVNSLDDCKVDFGTLTIENLDTYAYIYVGKAIQ